MTADEFINAAIDKGQSGGLASLNRDERLVYLISEAEVSCDINGIDTLLDSYSPTNIQECADAYAEIGAFEIAAALTEIVFSLPARNEDSLNKADSLIKDRVGYDYDSIRVVVNRRLAR